MKLKILAVVSVLVSCFIAFWVYGNSVIVAGERQSRWIVHDMWGSNFLYSATGNIEEHERINLLSLREGSSKNQELINYVVNNKCTDDSVRCYLIMTSASNILIDAGEYDSGLQGMVQANVRVDARGLCPIAYESAILKYKIKVASSKNVWSARKSSRATLDKIRSNNGFAKSLKTSSCVRLAKAKPDFFHEYTMMIAHLMGFAGGDYAKAGAYISFLNDNQR